MQLLKVDPNGKGTILDINDLQARKESSHFSRLAEIELGYGVEIPLVLTDVMYEREFVLYYTCDGNAGEINRPVMNILPDGSDTVRGPALFSKLIKDEAGYILSSLTGDEIDTLQEEMGVQLVRE